MSVYRTHVFLVQDDIAIAVKLIDARAWPRALLYVPRVAQRNVTELLASISFCITTTAAGLDQTERAYASDFNARWSASRDEPS